MTRLLAPAVDAIEFKMNPSKFVVISEPVKDTVNDGYIIRGVYPDFGQIALFISNQLFPGLDYTPVETGSNLIDVVSGIPGINLANVAAVRVGGKFGRGNIGTSITSTTVAYVSQIL